ncbi:Gluconate 2-dehydrogenase subunit 3 [Halopelagius inordinatus]|uniref:Gluconate 2-dehydrogenase subunit 3 n=1 Tax=Halopelagius inordinatus TaxID=553467 RepID=A0A1I2RRR3_9EURY|nr:gluconate 2-dehydrogenase subunit 3 family protein [Halopelagius inordinatus]SFG43212.1 Gluconate 2-dehydrogenase subunit 3 [Halopelagius inordinatus]
MELTRRDVVAALAASGIGSVAGCSQSSNGGGGGDGEDPADETPISSHDVATLVAVADVVYPSDAENVREFVENYSGRRVRADDEYARGVADAVRTLDDYVGNWHDESFSALSAADRSNALDRMSVDVADPDPDGVPRERVRYYLVNELLFAFYSTPTGAGLAGLENPPGHPGGRRSYRRGPER